MSCINQSRQIIYYSFLMLAFVGFIGDAHARDIPNLDFDGKYLVWSYSETSKHNIHKGNGEYIETIAQGVNQWLVPASGEYFVVAIVDNDWRNWARSETVFAEHESNESNNGMEPGDSTAPLQPQNFRAEVYSSSAVELFWDHAADYQTNNVTYNIFQNGEQVAVQLDAKSFYIDGLISGEQYEFSVSAVNGDSSESAQQSIAISTNDEPGSTNSTIINANNFTQIVADAVEVINMRSANDLLSESRVRTDEWFGATNDLSNGDAPPSGLEFISESSTTDSVPFVERQFTCLSGGNLTLEKKDYGLAPAVDRGTRFSNCSINNVSFDGFFRYFVARRSDRVSVFSDFEKIEDSATSRISGTQTIPYSPINYRDTVEWNDVNFEFTNPSGSTTASNLNLTRSGRDSHDFNKTSYPVTDLQGQERNVHARDYASSIDGSFDMSSPATGQQNVNVEISFSFNNPYYVWDSNFTLIPAAPDYPVSELGNPLLVLDSENNVELIQQPFIGNGQWQSGQLTITASDGSTVSLIPTPEDNDRNKINIILGDNERIQVESWNGVFQIHCSSVIEGCGDNAQPRVYKPRTDETRFRD